MAKIKKYKGVLPKISIDEMIEVDRLMMEEYHIELIQMMENAGRCLAILANQKFLKKKIAKKRVIVLAGTGGNGGGALVCARRLHNWGANIQVYMTKPAEKLTPIPRHQLSILQRIGVPILDGDALQISQKADLIIDGIIGYSVKGNPYGVPKLMIDWANRHPAPVLSLDTPSGLDLTTGKVHSPTIKATATLTLALPKIGLFAENAQSVIGDLYLGDISVPPELYREKSLTIQLPTTLFAKGDILSLGKSV